jgi:hypothetical protein
MGQCTQIAKSTKAQCKNDAIAGEQYCHFHKPGGRPAVGIPSGNLGLSEDEQKRFLSAFSFVEQEIYERTLKRVRNHVILVTAVVLVVWAGAGAVLVVGVRDKAVEWVTEKLSSDKELRKQVTDGAQSRIDTATELLDKSKKLADELDRESARVSAGLTTQLEDLHSMIDRVRQELEKAAPTNKETLP